MQVRDEHGPAGADLSIVVAGHAHVGSLSDCANLRASMEVASTYRVDPFRRLDHVRERLTLVRGPEPNDRKIEASQGAGNAAEGAMLTWRKIGCAMDFSEHSRLAMLKASELAHRLDADLELIHVHVLPMPVGDVVVTPEDLGAMALAEIENRTNAWRDEAARLAGRPVRSTVVPGDAAAEIVRLAREHALDVLVLGTRDRKGLKRLFLGSVAEHVVRDAPCAVLIVRREPAQGRARTEAEVR